MGVKVTDGNVKAVVVERTVIRADGTVEPLPDLYWHRNPLRRLAWRLFRWQA